MAPASWRLCAASLLCVTAAPAWAEIPSIVVTPYYLPVSIAEAGSAISVITRAQIEQSSPTSVAGLLKTVPGVTVIESGGAGGTAEVRLRGGETGHTLVLIDGVRVNDAATARDEFDFSAISPDTIERIEILRGPQSSIYGSDAMGGVVNIITRKPHGAPSLTATVEGGSYGTHAERLSGGFAKGDFSLLVSGEHVASAGFSRVGNRDHDEPDGFEKWNGAVSGRYAPADGPRFEFGVTGTTGTFDYDNAPPSSGSATAAANARNTVDKSMLTGYGRLSFDSPDGSIKQSLTGFATVEHRLNNEPPTGTYDYASHTVGAEYRATFGAGAFGQLLAGARLEQEKASYAPTTTPASTGFDDTATRYALFAGDQISPIDHLFLTFSGRYDGQQGADGFVTGRFTAAYDIPSTETKLRASLGTGAKRPTYFMKAFNLNASVTTPLQSEESIGGDVGIDQTLFDGRLTVSATVFLSRFSNLLNFDSGTSAYQNVGRATMQGLELGATVVLIPSRLTLEGTYTYLDARDAATGLLLARRPQHSGSATLSWTGRSGLETSLTATAVGDRFSSSGEKKPLPAYARLDLSASYPLNPHTRIFGRIENLTDVRYQDPAGYNTAGLSAYVGLTWRQ